MTAASAAALRLTASANKEPTHSRLRPVPAPGQAGRLQHAGLAWRASPHPVTTLAHLAVEQRRPAAGRQGEAQPGHPGQRRPARAGRLSSGPVAARPGAGEGCGVRAGAGSAGGGGGRCGGRRAGWCGAAVGLGAAQLGPRQPRRRREKGEGRSPPPSRRRRRSGASVPFILESSADVRLMCGSRRLVNLNRPSGR